MLRYLLPLFILLPATLFAQAENRLTSGIVAYNSGDYEDALHNLNEALANEALLPGEKQAKAWYYKGMTLQALLREATFNNDAQKLEKYQNAVLDSYEAFVKAIGIPEAGDEIRMKTLGYFSELQPLLLQTGFLFMNQQHAQAAFPYLNAAFSIGQNGWGGKHYLAANLRGQAYLMLGDSAAALNDFQEAINWYAEFTPPVPDFLAGYIYYRKAVLERFFLRNPEQALATVEAAFPFLDQEWQRSDVWRESLTADHAAQNRTNYEQVRRDLQSLKLDLLLNIPAMYNRALAEFDQAVAADPSNFRLLLSYASLLESTDTEKAVTMYRRALDADPSQVTAWFNLGALYVNQASGISVQMQTENDDARYKVLSDQMLAYLQEALPLLTRAHQLQPNDIAILQALKQITISLELPDLYQEYKQKLDALEGQ